MDVALLLGEYGGSAWARDLLKRCSRADLNAALASGTIVRLGRGRYTLPDRGQPQRVARAARGILSHESAALWHHWVVKSEPSLPVVTVPRGRRVSSGQREIADIRWAELSAKDIHGIATAPSRTLLDCARSLPFDAALAVADSALRTGDVEREDLLDLARRSPRTGRARAVRVAEAADARSANAFESVVRAISLEVPGLTLEPQVEIAASITPDLVDVSRRLVVECDSRTYRAEKGAFRRDQERFNRLVLDGWRQLCRVSVYNRSLG